MKILAADDETNALNILQRAVEKAVPDSEIRCYDRPNRAIEAVNDGFKPDAAFLDIEMPGISGLELARVIKRVSPDTNVIFVTGYTEYAVEAYRGHASGYIMKPVTETRVKEEMEHLRLPLKREADKKLRVCTFQNFEVYSNDKTVEFSRNKSKEIFAYLVDRCGSTCTLAEIAAVLWEDGMYDRPRQKQLQVYISEMQKSLSAVGAADVIAKTRNGIKINADMLDCDMYRFLQGDTSAVNSYRGEYMNAYSWAEFTVSSLNARL